MSRSTIDLATPRGQSRLSIHYDPDRFGRFYEAIAMVFSTQASYAAPLMLLAQNRQAERDRTATERDREVNARTLADTEYVARELAAIRLAVTELSAGTAARAGK